LTTGFSRNPRVLIDYLPNFLGLEDDYITVKAMPSLRFGSVPDYVIKRLLGRFSHGSSLFEEK
jgi:hypothetical protein